MNNVGFWKTKSGYITHKNGLTKEQIDSLNLLRVGDRLSLFVNDVREGEKGPHLSLKRSTLPSEGVQNALSIEESR